MRISRPSPGTILGGVALFVALGGTAYAATATIVNIADKNAPTHVAKVDVTGALKTSATVTGFVPLTPFLGHQYLVTSTTNSLIGANQTTVALTRLDLANYYDQTNGGTADIRIYEQRGDATTCNGATVPVGTYEVPAGQTFSPAIGSPIVLKPSTAGTVWCLSASASIQGSPSTYYLPEVSFSGYVVTGHLPPGVMGARIRGGAMRPRRVTG